LPPTNRDTVRGTLSIVGNEPTGELIMTPANDGESLSIAGSQLPLLRALRKVEIMAAGRFSGQRSYAASPRGARIFEADSFVVRGMDGVPARDGIIAQQNSRYFLLVEGRRLAVEYMPKPLQGKLGARVFLAGPLEAPIIYYGVILERP
ncbi:MAG: hypothetical protein ABJE47_06105, partial [bacterium]